MTHLADPDDERVVMVDYLDAAGVRRAAGLADLVHDSWLDRFAPGTEWQVYAFREPGSRVFLAEAHDDVVRRGYNLDGVRLGAESGPLPVGPGSVLRSGRWRFAD